MKKLLIAVALLIGTTTYAHTITKQCWLNGRYQFKAESMPIGQKCNFKLINNTGTFDTTFTITQESFLFSIPQPIQTTPVRLQVTSGAFSVKIWTDNIKCNTLPLKFGERYLEQLNDSTVRLHFKIYDVSNVNQIIVILKSTRKKAKMVAVIFPKDLKDEQYFKVDIKL